MTRNIDEMISERENEVMDNDYKTLPDGRFEITIFNKASRKRETLLVHPEHTFGDILESITGIGDKDGMVIFELANQKKSTTDLNMTLRDFGIGPGDELFVNGEGKVAAEAD